MNVTNLVLIKFVNNTFMLLYRKTKHTNDNKLHLYIYIYYIMSINH